MKKTTANRPATPNRTHPYKRDAFDEMMERDEQTGSEKEAGKLAKREDKALGRLENITLLEKQLSNHKLGKFKSAICN